MAVRDITPVVSMDTELKLILDTHNVRPEIQEFLLSEDVQCKTVTQFAVIASTPEAHAGGGLGRWGGARVR